MVIYLPNMKQQEKTPCQGMLSQVRMHHQQNQSFSDELER